MRKTIFNMMLITVLLMLAGMLTVAQEPQDDDGEGNIALILDASGSMRALLEPGRSRMAIARDAVIQVARDLPEGTNTSLWVYGHRLGQEDQAASCRDIENVLPLSPIDPEQYEAVVRGINAIGYTPLAASLELAAASLPPGGNNTIILLSDGEETCGGDPCAVAEALAAANINLVVHTVGFVVEDLARSQLECIASVARGEYYDAQDASQLTEALSEIIVPRAPQLGVLRVVDIDGTPADSIEFTLIRTDSATFSGIGSGEFPVGSYVVRVAIDPVFETEGLILPDETTTITLPISLSEGELEDELPFNVSKSGPEFTASPELLLDDDGTLHVLWQDTTNQNNPASRNLFYRSRSPEGLWSPTINLTSDFGMMSHHRQNFARQPDGSVCVFIDGQLIGSNDTYRYQRCMVNGRWDELQEVQAGVQGEGDVTTIFDSDGAARQAFVLGARSVYFDSRSNQLSDNELSTLPSLAVDTDGRLHLIFQRLGSTFTIVHRYSTDNGASWTEAEWLHDVNTQRSASNAQIAVDLTGGVQVIYRTGGAGGDALEHRRWKEGSGWSTPRNLLDGFARGGQLPQIAIDFDGFAHVVFRSRELQYTREMEDGSWSEIIQVSPGPVGQRYALVVDAEGAVHIVWDNEDRSDIFYNRIDPPPAEAEAEK